jgi:hypothetical protein
MRSPVISLPIEDHDTPPESPLNGLKVHLLRFSIQVLYLVKIEVPVVIHHRESVTKFLMIFLSDFIFI